MFAGQVAKIIVFRFAPAVFKKSAGSTITVIKVPGLGCWRADKIPMTELPALLGIKENED